MVEGYVEGEENIYNGEYRICIAPAPREEQYHWFLNLTKQKSFRPFFSWNAQALIADTMIAGRSWRRLAVFLGEYVPLLLLLTGSVMSCKQS